MSDEENSSADGDVEEPTVEKIADSEVAVAAVAEDAKAKERPLWVQQWTTIRSMPGAWEKAALGLACMGVVLFIWTLLTSGAGDKRIIGAYTLPSPAEAFGSFKELWFDRGLVKSALASLARVFGGFLLAAAVAIPAGVVSGSYPRVEAFFRPMAVFGRNVPIAALIPLTLIWFGLGETQKVMFIFLASVAFIFFDTVQSVAAVSNRYLDTAYTLGAKSVPREGAKRAGWIALLYGLLCVGFWSFISTDGAAIVAALANWKTWVAGLFGALLGFLLWFPIQSHQVIRKVLFPLSLPRIVNSMRLLFGLSFGYIMLAEAINAKAGLGKLIIVSQRVGPREHIYLCLMIIALLAFGIDRLVFYLQRRWFPYEENAHS